ncbi:MAG: C-terminal binding protein [Deltaproteobacteria bacterium]|nr:C-terminal binding protein [Deltaproteobacteria bacterium]
MSVRLTRWGRSPYETDRDLARERAALEALGLSCLQLPQGAPVADLADPDVLVVTSLTRVGADALDAVPRCRLLLTTTNGHDHLDLDAARARGIVVARCPIARRDAVVESALALSLALLKDLPHLSDDARAGRWVRADLPARPVALLGGQPVGVVGLGVIGTKMAAVLAALGASVLGFDPAVRLPGVKEAPVGDLLATCRLVTLHCSLAPGAPPVVDASGVARARPDVVLVNTARGGVLDLEAAWSALEAGRLGGLGLDVFPEEPYPGIARISAHPRVLCTPHGAGFHPDLGAVIARELQASVSAFLAGRPVPHRVA